MKREIHQLPLFADNQLPPPIPPCAAELTGPECPTPRDVANLIVRRTRIWQREHPGCDWHEIVTPNWHDYVAWHLDAHPH